MKVTFNHMLSGRVSAFFASALLVACASPQAENNLPSVPTNAVTCDPQIPNRLAHTGAQKKIKSAVENASPNKPAYQVQDDAKQSLEKFKVLMDKIFGCKTKESQELNELASDILALSFRKDLLAEIQNRMITNHFEDLMVYYDTESFADYIRGKVTEHLQQLYARDQSFDIAKVAGSMNGPINKLVEQHHNRFVIASMQEDLHRSFGTPYPEDAKRFHVEMSNTIGKEVAKALLELIKEQRGRERPREVVPEINTDKQLQTLATPAL